MRIGLLYPARNPLDPANWSGTPYGLSRGMISHGVEVIPIAADIPRGIHEAVAVMSRITGRQGAVADRMPVRNFARTRILARRLDQAAPLDAVLAMGTEMYDLAAVIRSKLPCVTYDDGTLAQMWNHHGFRHPKRWFPPWSSSHVDSAAGPVQPRCQHVLRQYPMGGAFVRRRLRDTAGSCRRRGHGPIDRALQRLKTKSGPYRPSSSSGWTGSARMGLWCWTRFPGYATVFPGRPFTLVGNHPAIEQAGVYGHGFLARNDAAAQRTLDRLYATSTCFVLPSKFDPSPISYLEAASSGLPVIATFPGGRRRSARARSDNSGSRRRRRDRRGHDSIGRSNDRTNRGICCFRWSGQLIVAGRGWPDTRRPL